MDTQIARPEARQEWRHEAPLVVDPAAGVTLLVIEDDPAVLRLVCRMLEPMGYEVLAAAHAGEAFDLFARHGGRVSVIVSDVVLPGISGPEIVRRLLLERPEVKVIFMSGHTSHALLRDGKLGTDPNFIQKPFARTALSGTIREVLRA